MSKLLLFTCLLFPVLMAAQSGDELLSLNETDSTVTPVKTSAAELEAHNKTAKAQLSALISEHLEYPENDAFEGLQGIVTATVSLTDDGRIKRIRITKSELPPAFGQQLVKALKTSKKITFPGPVYLGAKRINLPVRFSY